MSLDKVPINVFDFALIAVLVAGILRGRKHGMSAELLSLFKWLAVVFACAWAYQPAGSAVAQSSPISLLTCFMLAYVVIALLVLGIFSLFKHTIGGKLLGSDIFGRAEYYLGMGSGMIRFGCVLIAGLALLNARYFSPTEVHAMERFQDDVYGSNFFPTWHTAQEVVFEKSVTGPWIRNHLGFLLITPTAPENKELHQKEWSAQ